MELQNLQTPNNSNLLLKQLNQQELKDDLFQSLIIAMDRTQMELLKIEDTSDFIKDEFSFLTLNEIRKAIRNGSSGKYGRSYKLSTQEICFWIREYLKENKSKELKI